jgi:hypothetical protein
VKELRQADGSIRQSLSNFTSKDDLRDLRTEQRQSMAEIRTEQREGFDRVFSKLDDLGKEMSRKVDRSTP